MEGCKTDSSSSNQIGDENVMERERNPKYAIGFAKGEIIRLENIFEPVSELQSLKSRIPT